MNSVDGGNRRWRDWLLQAMRKAYRWGDAHIPPGLRFVLGLMLMGGGVLGFLPILGFWMLPLGAVLAAMDIPPLRRRLRRRLQPYKQHPGTPESR